MTFIISVEELPEKIKKCVIENYVNLELEHIFSFKTAYKPNPTIPLLWFVQLKDRISFCNTHRTRGIYKEIKNNSINSIRLSPSALLIEIISSDLSEENFLLSVEKGFNFKEFKEKLTSVGFEVIGTY